MEDIDLATFVQAAFYNDESRFPRPEHWNVFEVIFFVQYCVEFASLLTIIGVNP